MFSKYFLLIVLILGFIIGPLNLVNAEEVNFELLQNKISALNFNSKTTATLSSDQVNQLKSLQESLKQKLEELRKTEAIEKNGILYYDLSHVVQEISGITATASTSFGGLVTISTYLSNSKVFLYVSSYLQGKSQSNLILRLILKSAYSVESLKNYLISLKGRIPLSLNKKIPFKLNAKNLAIGAIILWMTATITKEKKLEETLWTANQKEILILQLEKMIQQIQDLKIGNNLLEEDLSSLFTDDNDNDNDNDNEYLNEN